MVVQAYAKLNLVLNVYNEITNGYHTIESLMIPISLHDSIDIQLIKHSKEVFVTCDSFELAGEQYNLVTKAIAFLREKYKFNVGFRITIFKRIFISGGLGGGSSDAAAVINAIIKKLKLKISDAELIELGSKIGSDVPFCIFNKPAIVKGTGNKLGFVELAKKKYYILLVQPSKGLSTKEVYQNLTNVGYPEIKNISETIEAYGKGENELGLHIHNGLEQSAFNLLEEVKHLKEELMSYGLSAVMMCGSGSTVFAISENKKKVFSIFKELSEKGYKAEFAKTI